MSTTALAPTATALSQRNAVKNTYEDDDDEGCEARSTDDGDEAGSLEDFIVEDESEEEEDGAEDDERTSSPPPQAADESRVPDLDGIDTNNILSGRRTRRRTQFYEQEVFNTNEYRRMMLEDVPEDERHAIEESDDEESDSDETSDGEYEEANNENSTDSEGEESDLADEGGVDVSSTMRKRKGD